MLLSFFFLISLFFVRSLSLAGFNSTNAELETFVDSDGVEKPLMEMNVLPNAYISEAVILMIVGFLLIYIVEKISMKLSK